MYHFCSIDNWLHEMSELLDKQVSVSNNNSGIHAGVTQAHEKCAMKNKRKNDYYVKNLLMKGRTLYGCIRSPA